ncbi:MAG: ATP-binding cassette domain-containing protein, partial [Clostridia bacterium]|nr:ATP-binding cassette domain-containing protein [Clostridia bacterium]
MLQVNNVSLQYGSKKLFEDVNIKFTGGNCYGIIGANGAGKSTFLKVLSGEIEPNKGEVVMDKNERMSVLMQNQSAFDNVSVLRAVMLGHKRLVQIMDEKDALYAKEDFSEADGVRASELESEFAELGGWEAEYEAQTLLNALDIGEEFYDVLMADVDAKRKVKILLAQALFGNPDILLL